MRKLWKLSIAAGLVVVLAMMVSIGLCAGSSGTKQIAEVMTGLEDGMRDVIENGLKSMDNDNPKDIQICLLYNYFNIFYGSHELLEVAEYYDVSTTDIESLKGLLTINNAVEELLNDRYTEFLNGEITGKEFLDVFRKAWNVMFAEKDE